MAKTVITTIQCDVCLSIDEQVEGETVAVAVDGTKGSIDLCSPHRAELVEPIVMALKAIGVTARKAPATKRTKVPAAAREVRDWARSNGYEVGDRARIPNTVREAFDAAHSS